MLHIWDCRLYMMVQKLLEALFLAVEDSAENNGTTQMGQLLKFMGREFSGSVILPIESALVMSKSLLNIAFIYAT